MEPSYTILGGDGKQYGPISAEEFRAWVQQGRVNGDTQVLRSGAQAWAIASSVPEFGVAPAVAVAAPEILPHGTVAAADPVLRQQIKNGSSWFYWIGALSLINSISAISGSDWRFFIGLGTTQFIDGVLGGTGATGKIIALVLDFIAAGLLILFGVLGGKGHAWAMLVGGILIGLDGILVAYAAVAGGGGSLWISFAFHAWAVFVIWRGFMAARALKP
ncbi:MAG TPA: DUF4339 domain-containing protein [Candidatus Acidoferrum sp.]|nr:DUF4339 domain-containing protein [Candidatus Acidoferrum sp.]